MKVSAIMTRDPVVVAPDCKLDEALRLLDEHAFRHLPVVEEGALVGILSDRDLLQATGWLERRVHAIRGPGMEEKVPQVASDIMQREVFTIRPSASLREAAIEIFGRRIGALPVLDGATLVGILTEEDMLRAYVEVLDGGEAPPEARTDVQSCMTTHMVTLQFNATLAEAMATAREADVHHLPVLQQDQLIGLVSDRDLRRAVGSGRKPETPVEEFMSRDLLTVRPEAPLQDAARVMIERKLGALPVVAGDDVRGIVTRTDVLDRCLALFRDDRLGVRGKSPS